MCLACGSLQGSLV